MLHIEVESGLEANGNECLALLFSFANSLSFVESYSEGLLEKYVDVALESVDCGTCVLSVVCTDGNRVELFVVDHILVVEVAVDIEIELCCELFCLTGDEVTSCNDLYVGALEITLNVGMSDPTGTDDTYLELTVGVIHLFFFYFLLELAENCI